MLVLQSNESGGTGGASTDWWVYNIVGVDAYLMSITYSIKGTNMLQMSVCIVEVLKSVLYVVFCRMHAIAQQFKWTSSETFKSLKVTGYVYIYIYTYICCTISNVILQVHENEVYCTIIAHSLVVLYICAHLKEYCWMFKIYIREWDQHFV